MGDVISIHSKKKFTQTEAESLLPVVRRITERAATAITDLESQLKFVPRGEPLHGRMQRNMESIISQWADKVMRLGCSPVGLWVVNFEAGKGCFSWRYGDEGLNHFTSHRKMDDFMVSRPQLPS